MAYVAAVGLAVPVGAIAWFEVAYLFFGLTGEDPPAVFSYGAAALTFGFAFGWPLLTAARPAEVVLRSCRLGMFAALLLPVVTIAVLLLWVSAPHRPDLGMGGLMLYNLPLVALGVAALLSIAFWIGNRLAGLQLQSPGRSKSMKN